MSDGSFQQKEAMKTVFSPSLSTFRETGWVKVGGNICSVIIWSLHDLNLF